MSLRSDAAVEHQLTAPSDHWWAQPRGGPSSYGPHSFPRTRHASAGSRLSPRTSRRQRGAAKSWRSIPQASRRPIHSRCTTGSVAIEQGEYADIARSVDQCVDVVSIQHEYGIWGGDDGAYVFDFIRSLRVPAVTTLHTVLADPSPRQRSVLSELVGPQRRNRRDVQVRGVPPGRARTEWTRAASTSSRTASLICRSSSRRP